MAIASAQSAVEAAKAGLKQTQSQHTQVSASARNERIAAQRALVRQMEASVQTARVAYDNTVLKAPFDGVVTALTAEVGEVVSPTVPVITLISEGNFDLSVSISESDIQEINEGDTATVFLDAYDDTSFNAKVVRISPNATILEGVRVFEVTLQFTDHSPLIRSGLSADIEILTAVRKNVLAVPTRAVVENEDGKFVRTLEGRTLNYLPVKTGLRGSDGQTEITEGLEVGQHIITFIQSETLEQLESK